MTAADRARESRRAQGLPELLTDPVVASQIAAILVVNEAMPEPPMKKARAS